MCALHHREESHPDSAGISVRLARKRHQEPYTPHMRRNMSMIGQTDAMMRIGNSHSLLVPPPGAMVVNSISCCYFLT